MTTDISTELPEQFTDKYFIYNGTDTMEEMVENIEKLKLLKSKCYYIKLGGQFYAVFIQSTDEKVVIGREKVYYTKNGRLTESSIADAKIGFEVNQRSVRFITDTLARELNVLYNSIEMYEYPTIKSKEYRKVEREDLLLSNYMVILGVTFASRFYTLDDAEKMGTYFKHTPELISFLRRTKGAVAIDPFSNLIRFKDGKIGTYSYKRTDGNRYYGYRSTTYYNGGDYAPKAIFALQEKNIYSPFRKREWISLTRYMAIYPDDDINYPKPDYRVEKSTCKWCGESLPEGKRSYCKVDCRLEFDRAVNLERGAIIPYLIMCRDHFICQTCDKDMARINEHGMKIPIPYLHQVADKDGKFRSEAEVDHITAVADGGNDHQSNLATICQGCHKEKHKKKKTKAKPVAAISTNNVVPFAPSKRRKAERIQPSKAVPKKGGPFASEKQLAYLEGLAKKNGFRLINTQSMWGSHASKLFAFFLHNKPIDERILNEYLERY